MKTYLKWKAEKQRSINSKLSQTFFARPLFETLLKTVKQVLIFSNTIDTPNLFRKETNFCDTKIFKEDLFESMKNKDNLQETKVLLKRFIKPFGVILEKSSFLQ